MSKVTIYTLGEPIMGTVKYVNYTADLDKTIEELYHNAETEPNTPLLQWVEDLLDGGWKPAVKKVKTVDKKVAVAETKKVYKEYASKFPKIYTGSIKPKTPRKKMSEETKAKIRRRHSKPVYQYDLQGNFIARHDGTYEASQSSGVQQCNISSQLTGRVRQAGGFFWSRTELTEEEKKTRIKPSLRTRAVKQCTLTGKHLRDFDSILEACDVTGLPSSNLVANLKGRIGHCGGFKWFYA